jgi:hypothetical protein
MCGVTLKDRKSCEELRQRLGIDSVSDVLRRNRLRWFGHVERKNDDDWVKHVRDWRLLVGEVEAGVRRRGENVLWRT